MIYFLLLYFSNLVLDYPLQDVDIRRWKCKYNYFLWVHCAMWGIGMALVLVPIGLFAVWKLIMLVIGHFVIDYWKCRGVYKKFPKCSDVNSLYIDQALHIAQILLCLIP